MSPAEEWTRRQALKVGLAAALARPAASRAAGEEGTALGFVLEETAGLRRFSYPVHTHLPGAVPAGGARLLKDGQVVPAQFRPVRVADGTTILALDFTASLGPLESERYVVEVGQGVEAGPEPKHGIHLEAAAADFRIQSGSALSYTIDARLRGLVEGVRNGGREYVIPGMGGLFLRTGDEAGGRGVRLGGADGAGVRGAITRQGPLAVGLRFEGSTPLPGGEEVVSTVDLTFPSSKSWVEAAWRVDDPRGQVAGLGVELRLALEGEPVLVDLGTAATIYGVLRGRERMSLKADLTAQLPPAGRPWVVEKGPLGKMIRFAEAPRPDAPPPEGWAHVMDASRCTALAVAGFGRTSSDQIEIETGGLVRIDRVFSRATSLRGPKALRFWFHFVPMPVQLGAATSPQAMLAPLSVMWDASRS